MQKELQFKVSGNSLIKVSPEDLTSGNISFILCKFTFDSSWDGLIKTVVFYQPKTTEQPMHVILATSDECLMPLINQATDLYIGVFGIKDNIRATTNFCVVPVATGSYMEGIEPPFPGWDMYEDLIRQIEESLTEIRQQADAAEQSAENAQTSENNATQQASLATEEAERAKREADRSTGQADRAEQEADRAKWEADRAQLIAGGEVITQPELDEQLKEKMDIVPLAQAGNIPVFTADGQITDSGKDAASIGDGNVKSVNGQEPDKNGNVIVAPVYVGADEPEDPQTLLWARIGEGNQEGSDIPDISSKQSFIYGSYIGDGQTVRIIDLGFIPSFGIIFAVDKLPFIASGATSNMQTFCAFLSKQGASTAAFIEDGSSGLGSGNERGFGVFSMPSVSNNAIPHLNDTDVLYCYMIWREISDGK